VLTGSSSTSRRPAAIRFEGASRDWVLDQNGDYRRVTPNEQAVVLALSVRRGALKSSPNVGNTLLDIQYLGGVKLGADIEDRVRIANPIARLLAAGAISIDRIDHETRNGKLAVAVYFRDLQVDKNRVSRAELDS